MLGRWGRRCVTLRSCIHAEMYLVANHWRDDYIRWQHFDIIVVDTIQRLQGTVIDSAALKYVYTHMNHRASKIAALVAFHVRMIWLWYTVC